MKPASEYKASPKAFLFGNLELLKKALREAPEFEGKSECLRCLHYAFKFEDQVKDVD